MAFPLGNPWSGANPTTAYSGTFIPEIWSSVLLEKFYASTVLGAIANTHYEGEIKNQGDTVNIRQRPDVQVNEYRANQDLVVTRPSSDKIQLFIDQARYFNVAINDVMRVQMDIDAMSIWAEDAAEQMKIAIDRDVLDYLTNVAAVGNGYDDIDASNKGNTAGKISRNLDLGRNTLQANAILVDNGGANTSPIQYILRCGQTLDEQNVPDTNRFLVIPAWFSTLIKDSDLKDASVSGDGMSMLRNGRLGMVDRFTLYQTNLMTDKETAGAWPILFGTDAGLTFASQVTEMESLRSERSFDDLLRGLQVYGRKVVKGDAVGCGFIRSS